MPDQTSMLTIGLIDDVSPTAKKMAEAMSKMASEFGISEAALAKSDVTDRLKARLKAFGASAGEIGGVTKAWQTYSKEQGIALTKGVQLTKQQADAAKNFENLTVASLRAVRKEQETSFRVEEQMASKRRSLREQELRHVRSHFKDMGKEMLAATGYMGVGFGVVSAAEKTFDRGRELQDARLAMRNAGIDRQNPGMSRAMESQSLGLSKQFGNITQLQLMELSKDTRSVMTKPEEVFQIMPTLAAAQSALKGGKVEGADTNLAPLVKGAEVLGAGKDPERMAKLIDGYVKAIQVMGTTISPEKIYEFARSSQISGARLSDRFLMTTAMSTLQELGGEATGAAVNQASKQLSGAGLVRRGSAVNVLEQLGMLNEKDVKRNKAGDVSGVRKGLLNPVMGAEQLASDPDKWFYDVVLPRMDKLYKGDEKKEYAAIQQMFSGSDQAGSFFGKLLQQRESYAAHAGMYGTAEGIKATEHNQESATQGINAFSAAMSNLQANVSVSLMEPVGKALYILADAMNYLAKQAAEHPIAASTMGVAAGTGVATVGAIGATRLAKRVFGFGPNGGAPGMITGGEGGATAARVGGSLLAGGAGTLALGGGVILAGGAAGGAMNSPMVDEYGRVIGGWGNDQHQNDPGYVGPRGAFTTTIAGRPSYALPWHADPRRVGPHSQYGDMDPAGSTNNGLYRAYDGLVTSGRGPGRAPTSVSISENAARQQEIDKINSSAMIFGQLNDSAAVLKAGFQALAGSMGNDTLGGGGGGGGGGFGGGGGAGGFGKFGSGDGFGGTGVKVTADDSMPTHQRAVLDMIAGGEAGGYGVRNRSGSSATGRYQFLKSTWGPLASKMGLSDMSPKNQDRAAWRLAADSYKSRTGRDLNADAQAGKVDQIAHGLNGVWPSLPGGSQQNQSLATTRQRFQTGLDRESARGATSAPQHPVTQSTHRTKHHIDDSALDNHIRKLQHAKNLSAALESRSGGRNGGLNTRIRGMFATDGSAFG